MNLISFPSQQTVLDLIENGGGGGGNFLKMEVFCDITKRVRLYSKN